MPPKTVLIIDDDDDIRATVADILEQKGYRVIGAGDGRMGLEAVEKEKPDLILLDVELPDTSGYDICEKIRTIPIGLHTPVIMLTAHAMEKEELRGFRSGADDYIAKPFKSARLVARIETAIGRNVRELDANALTHLPGNMAITQEIQLRIADNREFSVLYFDLNNFKAFNDYYGFIRGDQAIQLTAKILNNCISSWPNGKAFLGHVGGDDFVGIVDSHDVEPLCEDILRRFNQAVADLYDENDRARGMIISVDRRGNKAEMPMMGLAVAVVTNRHKKFEHPGEIALIAGDLKHWVKSANASAYVIDRRT